MGNSEKQNAVIVSTLLMWKSRVQLFKREAWSAVQDTTKRSWRLRLRTDHCIQKFRSSVVTSKNEVSVEHSGWKLGCNMSNGCCGQVKKQRQQDSTLQKCNHPGMVREVGSFLGKQDRAKFGEFCFCFQSQQDHRMILWHLVQNRWKL